MFGRRFVGDRCGDWIAELRDAAKFRAGARLRIRMFSFPEPSTESIWTIDGVPLSLVDRLEFFGS